MSHKSRHNAISVHIDRLNDERIIREYLPAFRDAYGSCTPQAVRKRCAEARAKGLEVFPPCKHVDTLGRCLGHVVGGEEELGVVVEVKCPLGHRHRVRVSPSASKVRELGFCPDAQRSIVATYDL